MVSQPMRPLAQQLALRLLQLLGIERVLDLLACNQCAQLLCQLPYLLLQFLELFGRLHQARIVSVVS